VKWLQLGTLVKKYCSEAMSCVPKPESGTVGTVVEQLLFPNCSSQKSFRIKVLDFWNSWNSKLW
jgi:hypothetical protein